MLGKRLYHSTSIASLKLICVFIIGVLFAHLNYQTTSRQTFQEFIQAKDLLDLSKPWQVFEYHRFYPEEYVFFLIALFLPLFYYGFVRGVTFYENGIRVNKGLPFFNTILFYKQIEKFELIHERYFISVTQKETGDDILFTVNDADRAIAILDQNGITGDLGVKAKRDTSAHIKLLLFFLGAGILVALVQYSDFIRVFFR